MKKTSDIDCKNMIRYQKEPQMTVLSIGYSKRGFSDVTDEKAIFYSVNCAKCHFHTMCDCLHYPAGLFCCAGRMEFLSNVYSVPFFVGDLVC